MSYVYASIDRTALPEELLDLQKTQMRVAYDDDDDFITGVIQRAISLFEKKSGQSIFQAEVEWIPDDHDSYSAQGARCPRQPVSDWTAADASADVTTSYTLTGRTGVYFCPVATQSSAPGPEWFPGVTVTMTVGYAAVEDIDPSIIDIILRIGAHLYENRQSTTDISLEEVPLFLDDLLVDHWVPRV